MGPGCKNKCRLRREEPLTDEFRQQIFDNFYGEGANEKTQVRIVTTYLMSDLLIDT